ncbi:hypothetical protein C8R43DRAFT_1112066 [Mycena crocata]|nr:hypothetical protein C8R43DRAFT_1112066 [Mycena crocata]
MTILKNIVVIGGGYCDDLAPKVQNPIMIEKKSHMQGYLVMLIQAKLVLAKIHVSQSIICCQKILKQKKETYGLLVCSVEVDDQAVPGIRHFWGHPTPRPALAEPSNIYPVESYYMHEIRYLKNNMAKIIACKCSERISPQSRAGADLRSPPGVATAVLPDKVVLANRDVIPYEYLIVATGNGEATICNRKGYRGRCTKLRIKLMKDEHGGPA